MVIGFVIFNLMPANPVVALTRGRPTSPQQMAVLRQQLHLDQPVFERFFSFVSSTIHGDLGHSWQYNQSVSSLIGERIGPTLLLTLTAAFFSVLLGLWVGVRSGWKEGSVFDRINSSIALTLWSVPTFWLGLILLVGFSVGFGPFHGIFPPGGMSTPGFSGNEFQKAIDVAHHLFLPCLTLVLVVYAQYSSIMRSSIIDEKGSPYLLTARAKGLRDNDVRRKHAVPSALLPTITLIFLQLGGVIGGAIAVETVYSWPGLGYLTYEALQIPDLPLLEGTFMVFSVAVILTNLLADLLYRYLDPRVRAQ